MSGKSRFDDLKIFLNRKDDNRIRLYAHDLQVNLDAATSAGKAYDVSNLKFTTVTPGLQNRYFKTPDTSKSDTDVHPEWETFAADLDKITSSESSDIDILNMIKKHSGIAEPQSEKDFIQTFIKAHTNELKNIKGDNIRDNTSMWSNVTNVKYFDTSGFVDNILNKKIIIGTQSTSPVTEFNYNFDKYVLNLYLEAAMSSASKGVGVSKWFSMPTTPSRSNTYYRDLTSGKLYRRGVKDDCSDAVEVGKGSEEFKTMMKESNNCYSLHVKDSGSNKCSDYMTKCLHGKDIKKCVEFMKDTDFWNLVEEDLKHKKVNPELAVHTLKQFQFNEKEEYDEVAKTNLNSDKYYEHLLNT